MKAFDITIENETHTLGHLIQSHINEFFKDKNIFVGYMNPHPLEKKIIIRLNVDNINDVKSIISETKTRLIKMCESLMKQISKEFKGAVKAKPKLVIPTSDEKAKVKGKKKKSKSKPKFTIIEDETESVGAPAP